MNIFIQSSYFIDHGLNEKELFENDIEKCIEIFTEVIPNHETTKIEAIKNKLFPHKNNIEEAREKLAELDTRPQHIGDLIDSENQKENEDQLDEGFSIDEEQAYKRSR